MARLMEILHEAVEARRLDMGGDPYIYEAAGVDDFANILGSQLNRTLVNAYQAVQMPWQQYCRVSQVSDFRNNDRLLGSEAERLLDLGRGGAGAYQDSKLTEQKYTIRANTKGRAFSVTRQALINDDLNYLTQQPERFGRSAARTLVTDVVINTLEANLPAYDGTAVYDFAAHANLLTGAGSHLTGDNVQKARQTIARSKFEGEYTGIKAKYLVVPVELENAARVIIESEQVWQPGPLATPYAASATPGYGTGNLNPLRGTLEIIVDPWLTSAVAWYVFADPSDLPSIDVAFLQGKQVPDLLVQRPEYRMVAGGGDDEYMHGEFDELRYAVRYDYGISAAMYQGTFKGAGA